MKAPYITLNYNHDEDYSTAQSLTLPAERFIELHKEICAYLLEGLSVEMQTSQNF
jgi:hypothetical protein